ncbi:MAG: ferric reductase-like transmembrane domain-containing protein [Roseibium sp.]|uniref:ferric reductase-like transmembrane domain-containing protein n=1 Tax=Roseibium sp. TaxID=1936156 RepID=UPI003D9C46D4
MLRLRAILIWVALLGVVLVPIAAAANSPLLQWRQPVYIAAGFAGIAALVLLVVQPLLAGGYLPGLSVIRGRNLHRWTGAVLVLAVIVHVLGLWITSPPDVVDALLFRSPTPFSVWGVLAMWAVFLSALLALFRRKLRVRPRTWRLAHTAFALVIVAGTVIHALLIEGTMETTSKIALCCLAVLAFLKVVADLKLFPLRLKRNA